MPSEAISGSIRGHEDTELAQVADQPGVKVAPEVFAERGLVAAGGAFPPNVLDLFASPRLLGSFPRQGYFGRAVQSVLIEPRS